MPISLLPQFFLNSLLLVTFCFTNFTYASTQCLDDQKSLLHELKNELIFDSSFSEKLVHWNQTNDCCRWEGVECDVVGHVIGLQLDDKGITGGLENSSSLFSLSYLKKLNLADNNFNGTQIPGVIGNLTYLTHLNLARAGFGGQIPIQLSLLKRLVSLAISTYPYKVIQPLKLEYPNLKMLLQNLTGLRELHLDYVDISSQRNDWYDVISSFLPDLRNLSLTNCSLSSPSDPSLSHFHSFTSLQLNLNNLSVVVPNFFANFSNLTVLSLYGCSLKGSLDMSNNSFAGSNSFMPFRGPYTLVYLDLSSNSLSGSIPQFLFSLPLLKLLFLGGNQFSGQIKEFSTLNSSNLEELDLGPNRLEGPIPDFFFQLGKLRYFRLDDNFFNGTFQLEKIQRLHNLEIFSLSHNNLSVKASNTNSSLSTFPQLKWLLLASCNLYYFPDFIKQQSYLTYLDLSNNRIAGEIPSWIWKIGNGTLYELKLSSNLLVDLQKPYHIPNSLGFLDLQSNQLRGELPLPPQNAYYVDYSNNNFDKPFPPDFGNFTHSLYLLSLANNSINGSIPSSLCKFVYLEVLDLSDNKLTGNIPPCLLENMKGPVVFNLRGNSISGDIPDKFSVNCSLQTLDLSNNRLERNIPSSLENCKSLLVMNIGHNNIDDSFPCKLPSSLRVLVLRSNRIHGEVGCLKSLPNLQIIDLAYNNFSGNLHPELFPTWRRMMLENDTQLKHANSFIYLSSLSYYMVDEPLTLKGLELKFVKIWGHFASIDFSCNNFQGQIPDSVGNLSSLYHLNLSHNSLTDTIPNSFGNLRQLESLDLSVNQLTGMIPVELASLTFLSVLNLSYNKLVGEIPLGPQLQLFPRSSFEGNTGLCGFSLNISCHNTTENDLPAPEVEHGETDIEWDYAAVVLGHVVGLGSFVWLFLCCRGLRRRYFEKVDDVLDKICNCSERKRRQRRRVHIRNQVRRH